MTRYGLPEQVRFCTRCVISNQRPSSVPEHLNQPGAAKPTIQFDEEGVCSACRYAERKLAVDWKARDEDLRKLLAAHRSKLGNFDCVVPGSGGKDSFYAAHVLKHVYGMHPLLMTWAPTIFTDWGWRNLVRWQSISSHRLYTPNRETHRLFTRLSVENLFHPFATFMLGQKNLAPKVAIETGIPLVIYGEPEGEYGNPVAELATAQRDSRYFALDDFSHVRLGGVPVPTLQNDYGVAWCDLSRYLPAESKEIARVGVEVHYLGYYLRWTPQENYYYAVEHGGFEASPDRQPGTYSKYSSIDDKIDDFHYWTTFQKFGIGRATYDAAQEIRNGHITREEGVALVHRFDGEYPERFEREVNEYLSVDGFPPMTHARWMMLAEQFRSPHLFDEAGQLRSRVE